MDQAQKSVAEVDDLANYAVLPVDVVGELVDYVENNLTCKFGIPILNTLKRHTTALDLFMARRTPQGEPGPTAQDGGDAEATVVDVSTPGGAPM